MILVAALATGGCKGAAPPRADDTPTTPAPRSASVTLPESTLRVGSVPGTPGRVPANEADRVEVELGEFSIDRQLVMQNGRPRTAQTRAQAAAICEAEGRRLCSELEWERACVGDGAGPYPTGASFDAARCAVEPCASPTGVEMLGTRFAEWTASEVPSPAGGSAPWAVVRGSASADAAEHRCAARRFVSPSAIDPNIAFRCCEGDPPEASYPVEPRAPVFESLTVETAALRAALASVPELASHAADFRLYRDNERAELIARAAAATPPVVVPTGRVVQAVLRWTPIPGETVWVVAGRSGNTGILAVLHPVADGSFVHAASLVMSGDPSTIVVTMRDPELRTLGFSTCFGCGGEDGEIKLRDDGRFVVVTR